MLIPDLLDGLADRLRANVTDLTVSVNPAAEVEVPMAIVADQDMTYNATMGRGSDDVAVNVTVYVSRSDNEQGMFEVREYKSGHGDKSIRYACETSTGATDPLTVAGVMVRVDSATSGVADHGGTSYIALNVSLLATVDGLT